ncbi:hypothetical protein FACS189428_7650 [Clostridia bacterium]|nr:hypothetical protein FACS189428_7650 [Clostridia bacterium]
MNISLIGAGNVATQLGIALQEKGYSIVQVYSRSLASAEIFRWMLKVCNGYNTPYRLARLF